MSEMNEAQKTELKNTELELKRLELEEKKLDMEAKKINAELARGWPSITRTKEALPDADDHPVVCVSWQDARDYVAWINKITNRKDYALPTEVQWEYGARAVRTAIGRR